MNVEFNHANLIKMCVSAPSAQAIARPFMTSKVADIRVLPSGMVESFHDKARNSFDKIAAVSHDVKVIDKSDPSFGKEGRVVFWKDGNNIKVYDPEGVKRVENDGKTKIRIYP